MERYRFPEDQLALIERMRAPLAVYQFIDHRVVALALSDGFLEMFGYGDRRQAYRDMDDNMYEFTHPDDAARVASAAVRFAREGGRYDVTYRTRTPASDTWRIIRAQGEHVTVAGSVTLAQVWYTDEGPCDGDAAAPDCAVSRRLQVEAASQASHYDPLTGLPAMTYFFDLAVAGKRRLAREGRCPAILYIDLSGIKNYNRRFGFSEGDRLLLESQPVQRALSQRHLHTAESGKLTLMLDDQPPARTPLRAALRQPLP